MPNIKGGVPISNKLWISHGDTRKVFVRASQGECCVEILWLWVTYFKSYDYLKKNVPNNPTNPS